MSAPEQHSTETLSPHDHEQESKTVAEKGQKVPEPGTFLLSNGRLLIC
ncbi:hypothetical protein [Citrobacter freundii]|nr:hypothetical protein [Citrobacter freundii]